MGALILIVFFVSTLAVAWSVSKLEKKYGVKRAEAGEPLRKIERLAGWINAGLLLVIIGMAIMGESIHYIGIMLFVGVLALLQTLVEWKYVRNTRRSIISLALTGVLLLSILGMMKVVEWATSL